jgi:hypothetical protein
MDQWCSRAVLFLDVKSARRTLDKFCPCGKERCLVQIPQSVVECECRTERRNRRGAPLTPRTGCGRFPISYERALLVPSFPKQSTLAPWTTSVPCAVQQQPLPPWCFLDGEQTTRGTIIRSNTSICALESTKIDDDENQSASFYTVLFYTAIVQQRFSAAAITIAAKTAAPRESRPPRANESSGLAG